MKNTIICGVCAVGFLLLITPTIPAQQYTLVKETIEEDLQQHLTNALIALKSIEKDQTRFDDQKQIILKSFNEMKLTMELGGLNAIPTCFKFLISTLLSLILAALGTLFGIVFGPILSIIVKVITFPAVLLAKILEMLFGASTISAA